METKWKPQPASGGPEGAAAESAIPEFAGETRWLAACETTCAVMVRKGSTVRVRQRALVFCLETSRLSGQAGHSKKGSGASWGRPGGAVFYSGGVVGAFRGHFRPSSARAFSIARSAGIAGCPAISAIRCA